MNDFVVSSIDENNYSKIKTNLDAPLTLLSKMTVTGLTTNCTIIVIEDGDFIQINDVKYVFTKDYTTIERASFIYLLNQLLQDSNIEASLDDCYRVIFESSSDFTINDASYNIRLLTGLYATDVLPINSSNNQIRVNSVGYMLSTPVLYLISNIGSKTYRNKDSVMTNSKILMRLNNSYSPNYPIIVTNGDFTTTCNSNDLSNIEFELVDANMHKIRLLNPLYLMISITAIPDATYGESHLLTNRNSDP